MRRLQGKSAIVTGGASGIGRAIAILFAAEGARVAIGDVNASGAAATADEIEKSGGRAMSLALDVSRAEEVEAFFARVVDCFGGLDVLVNNAGIAEITPNAQQRIQAVMMQMMSGGERQSLGVTRHLADSDWHQMLAVHLYGTFYCTRAALRVMEDQRSGSIINMASVAGLGGLSVAPHYGAAKAGIIGFTKSVAQEVGGAQIRVNAIAPGFIETAMTASVPPPVRQMILFRTPLGRTGSPEDIARTALFLASDESSFITGQVISPNGGLVT